MGKSKSAVETKEDRNSGKGEEGADNAIDLVFPCGDVVVLHCFVSAAAATEQNRAAR